MKQLLLSLITVLAFLTPLKARVGDDRSQLIQHLNTPVESHKFGKRVETLIFTDGQEVVFACLLDGVSVSEAAFDRFGSKPNSVSLERLLSLYGQKWFPIPCEPDCRQIINETNDIVVAVGSLPVFDKVIKNTVVVARFKEATEALRLMKESVEHPMIGL